MEEHTVILKTAAKIGSIYSQSSKQKEFVMAEQILLNIYGMRHGEKTGGGDFALLTNDGIQQVIRSAQKNLCGIEFHGLYSSGKARANQTVACCQTVGICGGIEDLNEFDYSDCPFLDRYAEYSTKAQELAKGEHVAVGHWREAAPEYTNYFRARLILAFEEIALGLHMVDDTYSPQYNILVGNHSPLIELAAPADEFPLLREADIIRYTVEVEYSAKTLLEYKSKIINAVFLDRGF